MNSAHDHDSHTIERLVFSNRLWVLLAYTLITLFLGYKLLDLKPASSFMKLIPVEHPYIVNMLEHRGELESMGNTIRISVEAAQGDIFSPEYMDVLKQISDEVFYLPGVDRAALKSLWTANVRWSEVTEEGFEGGPVIPRNADFSHQGNIDQLRSNILRSSTVGRLVANDFKSSIVEVPLMEIDPATGEKLDYQQFSHLLEEKVRDRFASDDINIQIIGFAKKIGDLIDGISSIVYFFVAATLITLVLLYLYSFCSWSTITTLFCSCIAVIWQLGLLSILGFGLDPYSVLVPFLVFAIAISHGVQIVNALSHECASGSGSYLAACRAFRALYVPGMLALVSDAIGFLTLLVINIGVIQDLAIAASLGVAVVILTNLILLPILISYTGVSPKCLSRVQRRQDQVPAIWNTLAQVASPKIARVSLSVAILLAGAGFYFSQDLKIGDLDEGAPELRANSRYNLDNKFITTHYSTSADVLVTMVETPPDQCSTFAVMDSMDRYMWAMENTPGVISTLSLVSVSKRLSKAMNEGNMKWQTLPRNAYALNDAVGRAGPLANADCSFAPILLFLRDHKAETLEGVVAATKAYASAHNTEKISFKLAAGNAGIEAATNEVIAEAQQKMLLWVYAVVSFLCLLTFRSWRAVVCIIAPLALTSVLCQALMTQLGIGVKVATLPVIALGVGIGVDYGIYIFSRMQSFIRKGLTLQEAYYATLCSTGKAVSFTGITLAIGVGTWIFSPIKFQADMGILLTFMFLWNMLGALVLLPALACFLVKDTGTGRIAESVQ